MTILTTIASRLGASSLWAGQEQTRADAVARYGRYAAGLHDNRLSPAQLEMLNLTSSDRTTAPATNNYMGVIISSMVDRCSMRRVDVAEPEANQGAVASWAARVLNRSRWDGEQARFYESAIRDGDCYLVVTFDEAADLPRLVVEPAFDGYAGVLGYYADGDAEQMTAAARIWQVAGGTRVNLMFPDRVERYFVPGEEGTASGALLPYTDEGEDDHVQYYARGAEGLPVFHLANAGARQQHGVSEIASAMPLQDILNRVLISWAMALEYSGFPLLVARGFPSPTAIKPGAIVNIAPDGLEPDRVADFTRLEGGDLSQFPIMAAYLAGEMGRVSRTPAPEFVAPTASGEARKQAESGMIGKVERFTQRAGNVIENALAYAWRIAQVYARAKPPAYLSMATVWKSPELRDDAAVVASVLALYKETVIGRTQALRMIAQVYGWDDREIARIVQEQAQERADAQAQGLDIFAGGLPALPQALGVLEPV